MKLVSEIDLLSAAKINQNAGSLAIAQQLLKALKLDKINQHYEAIPKDNAHIFLHSALASFNIKVDIDAKELENIPEEGAFIIVANHPFGGADGIIMLNLLLNRRPDFKMMANYLLEKITPLKDHVLSVNPFETTEGNSSYGGIKESLKHLNKGHCLGIFPSGEVSSYQASTKCITDPQWQTSIMKLILKSKVPVVPMYFKGCNSTTFQVLGMINPSLRTVKLPSEMLNKGEKAIRIRIGKPIDSNDIQSISNPEKLGRYLRARTYALGTAIEVNRFYIKKTHRITHTQAIEQRTSTQLLAADIVALPPSNLLLESGNFQVFYAEHQNIPHIIHEIGRQREIAFRAVGEGTNLALDLDEFDLYYEHLFVWDKERQEVAGAYRVGMGKEIITLYGKKGMYSNTLFKFKKDFHKIFRQSLELGRSFVHTDYQQKPLPLFLLWKGILQLLVKNPSYRYIIGPVSISNEYSGLSKALIIDYLTFHHYDHRLGSLVKPRNKFKVKLKKCDLNALIEHSRDNLKSLDAIIEDIEPANFRIPILIKKYLKQNAKIISFNVDPKFNKTLDGLMVLDLFNLPVETIKGLTKENCSADIFNRFHAHQETQYNLVPQF